MLEMSRPGHTGPLEPFAGDIPAWGCRLPPLIPSNVSHFRPKDGPLPPFASLDGIKLEYTPTSVSEKRTSPFCDGLDTQVDADMKGPRDSNSPRSGDSCSRPVLPWHDWSFEKKTRAFLQISPARPQVKSSVGPKAKPAANLEEGPEARRKRETHSAAEKARRSLAKETENAIHEMLPDAVLEHVRGSANDPKPPNKQDILDGAGLALPFARDIIEQIPSLLDQINALVENQQSLQRTNEEQRLQIQNLKRQLDDHTYYFEGRGRHSHTPCQEQSPNETAHRPWSQTLCRRPHRLETAESPYRSSHGSISERSISGTRSKSSSSSPVLTELCGFTVVNHPPSMTRSEPSLRRKRTRTEMDAYDLGDAIETARLFDHR